MNVLFQMQIKKMRLKNFSRLKRAQLGMVPSPGGSCRGRHRTGDGPFKFLEWLRLEVSRIHFTGATLRCQPQQRGIRRVFDDTGGVDFLSRLARSIRFGRLHELSIRTPLAARRS